MIATYHNHTTWSDGVASIDAMIEGAAALGVDELGISDHLNLHPSGLTPSWAMAPTGLADYVDAIRSHHGRFGPIVRLGLEVDWHPGHGDAIRASLARFEFDYLIASVHEVNGFPIDASATHWDEIDEDERNERHREYWRTIASMARSGLFDIAAHLDLPKKFGHRATADLRVEIALALDAIAEAGMVVELNTAGWHRPCESGYPSLDVLVECHRRSIPVTLSSDAHEPDHLVRDFKRGAARLEEAGYAEVARFAARVRTFEPLAEAVSGL